MSLQIKDKDIDRKLEEITNDIRTKFGIKTCTKSDAIRFLLGIRKQGKKTHRKWKKIIDKR